MTLYNVHIYREMKLLFNRIEADTPEAAAAIARDKLTGDADDIDDCDGETFAALVDVIGDERYEHSVTIDFEPERLRKAAPTLHEALKQVSLALAHHRHWQPSMVDHLRNITDAAIAETTPVHINLPERNLPMTKTKPNPIWIHITVSGGLVQRVFSDVPAIVFIEDFDNASRSEDASLAKWEAEPLTTEELLRLLKQKAIPHRVVIREE